MDRPIIYTQEQLRSFDAVGWETDALVALAQMTLDFLGGTRTVLGGLAATPSSPASLVVNLAAGSIYQLAATDATAIGKIPQNLAQIMQQGIVAASTVTLSTSGIAGGQSRYALIQAQFNQVDEVAPNDPNGGVVPFYNAANPADPIYSSVTTDRTGVVTIGVITGTAATTGSELPPSPTAGWTPLYLIDLAFGQTTVTAPNILVAGPSVGTNVPSNYPAAPFLAGLLNSHHGGTPGQAPQIKLTSEVQGTLPVGNLPAGTRIILTAPTTFYINGSTGNDTTGNGTSGAPWATWQKAWNTIINQYDCAGYQPTINQAGTNTDALNATGLAQGVNNMVILNVTGTWSVTNGSCITAVQTSLHVKGSGSLAATGSSAGQGSAFNVEAGAIVFFEGIAFGACTQAHMQINNSGAYALAVGNYSITGASAAHVAVGLNGACQISNETVTITGTPAFSTAFAVVSEASTFRAVGNTFTGSATGSRYSAVSNGVIDTAGAGATYLPGNAGGSTATGGQYL